jgi:hypothetical protein
MEERNLKSNEIFKVIESIDETSPYRDEILDLFCFFREIEDCDKYLEEDVNKLGDFLKDIVNLIIK